MKDKKKAPAWISREEASRVLNVSMSTIDNYRRAGLLEGIVLAGKRRRLINTKSVINLIANSPSTLKPKQSR